MGKGIVYVLVNESMPGIVKIGKTEAEDVGKRIKQLSNQTCIPTPFQLFLSMRSNCCEDTEAAIHEMYERSGRKIGKEFYKLDMLEAVDHFYSISRFSGNPLCISKVTLYGKEIDLRRDSVSYEPSKEEVERYKKAVNEMKGRPVCKEKASEPVKMLACYGPVSLIERIAMAAYKTGETKRSVINKAVEAYLAELGI